jgi:hypothetical protein
MTKPTQRRWLLTAPGKCETESFHTPPTKGCYLFRKRLTFANRRTSRMDTIARCVSMKVKKENRHADQQRILIKDRCRFLE